jgi:hypothetical protein
MLEEVVEDVASWCWLYLSTKPPHMGVDVDGLACPLHHHMACSHQTREQGFMSGTALSRQAAVGGGAFPWDVKPQAWIIGGVLTIWVPALPNLT